MKPGCWGEGNIKRMQGAAIILVDVGNTSTHVCLERGGRLLLARRLPSAPRDKSAIHRIAGFYASRSRISGAILCSVVPALDRLWLEALREVAGGKVMKVSHALNLGIGIDYPRPATIGADRLANAAAAAAKYGAPVIVADFGTALTFDIVSASNAYAGGIIAPGPALFYEYLAEKTALLPRLSAASLGAACARQTAIGKSTRQAMAIGMRLGYHGMIREIVSRLKTENGLRNARLCATGGYSKAVLAGSGLGFRIDPFLTLWGISRIYHLNKTQ